MSGAPDWYQGSDNPRDKVLEARIKKLEDKLAIAVEALERLSVGITPITYPEIALDALIKIKENK